ncbi:Or9e74CTE, partial [Eciton burchellii]
MMICIEHFNVNRILMLAIGLWPYNRSKLVEFQLFVYYNILISFILFQLTSLLTSKCTSDFIIEVLSYVLFFLLFLVNYNAFWINIDTVKSLLDQLQHICDELRDKNEIAIISKYGQNAKRYTIILLLFGICNLVLLMLVPIWSRVLGFILTEFQSRHLTEILNNEYFINEEKYFYLILIHFYVSICIGGITLVSTGSMLISYFKHVCGMFKIASYRIEKAMAVNILEDNLENRIMTYKEIIYAVDIHCKALKFTRFLMSNFEGSMFSFTLISVVCLSLHFFQLFQLISHKNDAGKFLIHFLYMIAIFIYMFLSNYAGQEITDHHNHIFITA